MLINDLKIPTSSQIQPFEHDALPKERGSITQCGENPAALWRREERERLSYGDAKGRTR